MNMVEVMTDVLNMDAEALQAGREQRGGKSVARVIGEALALSSMDGDIKAAAMLTELAGMDFRSRDSTEKHELDRQKLNLSRSEIPRVVVEDVRP